MASTFTLKSNSYDGRALTLTCTQTVNASGNSSTINWTLTSAGGSVNYYSTGPTTVTIGGTKVYEKARVSYSAQTFPAAKGSTSGSLTVNHNADGTKSVAVSLSTAIYYTAIDTKSGTWTLDSIASGSTANITNGFIGDWATLTIAANNSSYRHTVSFTCLDKTTTVGTNLASGSHRFMIPLSYNDVFGTRTSADAIGTCKTYNGSTLIEATSFQFTIYAQPVSNNPPIIECEAYDNNSTTLNLTGDSSVIIPGYSNIRYSVTATGQGGATISSYKVENGSAVKTTSSGTFTAATSRSVTFTVTDNKGNVAQDMILLSRIMYTPLTCNMTGSNLTAGGSMSIKVSGNYFNQDFGNLYNTLTVYYRYKEGTGSYTSWFPIEVDVQGNTYSGTMNLTGLNPDATYTFQARAVDRLSDVTSGGANVQNKPIFDWSGTDFNFNVPVNFSAGFTGAGGGTAGGGDIEGDLTVTGGASIKNHLRLQGAVNNNYGNRLYFGDGSYAYIGELTDDDLTIHSEDINLDGEVYLNSGLVEGGYWTPELNDDAISSYSIQEGWYQIVGNTATVGFLISANAYSGYHTERIEITGFPYDIELRGAGGGIAYNIYTTPGFSFTSWMFEEDGTITPRLVPNNNTTSGNVSITTNGCYPQGGGTFTLSGTICCKVDP